MPGFLEIPESLTAVCFNRNDALGEAIAPRPCAAIPIRALGRIFRLRSCYVDHAALLIQCHARPIVGAARQRKSFIAPRGSSFLTGLRNSVKGPLQLSC